MRFYLKSPSIIILAYLFATLLFSCNNASDSADSGHTEQETIAVEKKGSNLDPEVVGTWMHETNTSTGNSELDIYSNRQETLIFEADGSLNYGGSQTMVGGATSDFSQEPGKELPGVTWSTENQCIYITAKDDNGKDLTAKLGRYFIENGKMLITPDQGEKFLLIKQ